MTASTATQITNPSLKARLNRRPLALFALVAAAAFGTMFVAPAALDTLDRIAKADATVAPMRVTVAPPSASDIACRGQAWGAESDACLAAIAREASGSHRAVRRLADASPLWTTSQVY